MATIRFKSGNVWPLMRVLEASVSGDSGIVGLDKDEMAILKEIMSSCKMQQESGSVYFRTVTVKSLTVLMKALDTLSGKCELMLGGENGPQATAQARSLRRKILEVKTRLDLTGGL